LQQKNQTNLSTAIDNMFVDSTRFSSPSISSIKNGLSDHDVQYLMINNVATPHNLSSLKRRRGKINKVTNMQFQLLLNNETWKTCL
jgi:phosphoribosylaminoimidazole-succinocarboxamide synthase